MVLASWWARFNEHGLAALTIASGRGRKPTYTSQDRALILQEVQRSPDLDEDHTVTWSLTTLRRALRKKQLPHITNGTIREVLHESGYRYHRQTHTWCRTGRLQKPNRNRLGPGDTRKKLIEQVY